MMKISFIATIKHLSTGKQNFEIEFEEVWKTAEQTESNHFVGESLSLANQWTNKRQEE